MNRSKKGKDTRRPTTKSTTTKSTEPTQSPYSDCKALLSVVLFVDILGYREMATEAAAAPDKGRAFMQRLRSALARARDHLKDDGDMLGNLSRPPMFASTYFTDNIVMGWPLHEEGEEELGYTMKYCSAFQMEMVKHGFFVRGGLDVGMFYLDEFLVFGQRLSNAYTTESVAAVNPRVALTGEAVRYINNHMKFYGPKHCAPQNSSVLVDQDGLIYLDYLMGHLWELGRAEIDSNRPNIEVHRDIVSKRLVEFRATPKLWNKYAWVGVYHNSVVERWYDNDSSLRVSNKLLSRKPTTLAKHLESHRMSRTD